MEPLDNPRFHGQRDYCYFNNPMKSTEQDELHDQIRQACEKIKHPELINVILDPSVYFKKKGGLCCSKVATLYGVADATAKQILIALAEALEHLRYED